LKLAVVLVGSGASRAYVVGARTAGTRGIRGNDRCFGQADCLMRMVAGQGTSQAPLVGEVAFNAVTGTIGVGLDDNNFSYVPIDEVSSSVVIGTNFEISRCACWAT